MNFSIDIHKLANAFLTPLSYLYGAGIYARNKLFDWNALKSESFDIPVISIGNIAVGGTGKTPHTEYIINLCAIHTGLALSAVGTSGKHQASFLPLSTRLLQTLATSHTKFIRNSATTYKLPYAKKSKRHKTITDRAPGNQLDSPRRCVPASVCQAISVYCTDGIQPTVLQRPAASVGSLERKRPVRAQQSGFCHCDKMPRQHNSVGFAAV